MALFLGSQTSTAATTSGSGGSETDGGPQNDPDGLTAGAGADGGPQNDPNGSSSTAKTEGGSQNDPNG
jgi:hypothetical protein